MFLLIVCSLYPLRTPPTDTHNDTHADTPPLPLPRLITACCSLFLVKQSKLLKDCNLSQNWLFLSRNQPIFVWIPSLLQEGDLFFSLFSILVLGILVTLSELNCTSAGEEAQQNNQAIQRCRCFSAAWLENVMRAKRPLCNLFNIVNYYSFSAQKTWTLCFYP